MIITFSFTADFKHEEKWNKINCLILFMTFSDLSCSEDFTAEGYRIVALVNINKIFSVDNVKLTFILAKYDYD